MPLAWLIFEHEAVKLEVNAHFCVVHITDWEKRLCFIALLVNQMKCKLGICLSLSPNPLDCVAQAEFLDL